MMPFERIRPHLECVPEARPNIELSTVAAIRDDCARSSVVLYRGSSSVLYAVLQGLKPVYVHEPTLRDTDPLFELTGWRTRVSSPSEFAHLLRAYAVMGEEAVLQEWQDAAAYISRYTVPVDGGSLDALQALIGLSGDRVRP